MATLLATEAVVLGGTDVGESDRIVTLVSPQRGQVRAAASAARRHGKGRSAPLDLFSRVALELVPPRREGGLWRIATARMLEPHLRLRDSYLRLAAASYAGEYITACVREDDPQPALYRLLLDTLDGLCACAEEHIVLLSFEARLLELLGWRPELNRCQRCGETSLSGGALFSVELGGALHPHCAPDGSALPRLSPAQLSQLRFLTARGTEAASRLSMEPAEVRRLHRLLHPFTLHHLGFEPRSAEVLFAREDS